MATTTVLLVDDHELFLQGVRVALAASNNPGHNVWLEVVGSAMSGSEVLPLVRRLRPALVLLDVGLPGLDGLALLELLRARHPEVRVVMLSASEEQEYVQAALQRGAAGYILKTIDPADLAAAVRQIVEGTVYATLPASAAAANDRGLSGRELEILRYAVRGLPNRAIAEKLYLTQQTVKFHLTNIYRKLGVPNRTSAAREAHRLGIFPNPHADGEFVHESRRESVG